MELGAISGIVTLPNNNPASNASIFIKSTDVNSNISRYTTTDKYGSYIVSGLPPVYSYNVTAYLGSLTGYAYNISVTNGETTVVNIKLEAAKPTGIYGFVKDVNGNAIADAEIHTLFMPVKIIKTDKEGFYQLVFAVCREGRLSQDVTASKAGYFPSTKKVSVLCGSLTQQDFTLFLAKPENNGEIVGTVIEAGIKTPTPISNVTVAVLNEGGGSTVLATTGIDGKYSIHVSPGYRNILFQDSLHESYIATVVVRSKETVTKNVALKKLKIKK